MTDLRMRRKPWEDGCDLCGARLASHGWQPEECTGDCARAWRDPDIEADMRREDRLETRENVR